MCYFFFLCGDYFSPMSCCARTDKSNWWALEKTCCHGVLGPLGVHIHNKTCNMFVNKLRLIKKARGISSFLGTVFRLPFFFYWRTLSQYLYPRVWFLSLGKCISDMYLGTLLQLYSCINISRVIEIYSSICISKYIFDCCGLPQKETRVEHTQGRNWHHVIPSSETLWPNHVIVLPRV